jgi:ABC-type nitrate/sulfonate/bicarbonate transport system permease component
MFGRIFIGRQVLPVIFGLACLAVLLVIIEALIGAGLVNRFIVPQPSEIARSFERVIVEEQVFIPNCAIEWWSSADHWRSASFNGIIDCLKQSRFALTVFEAFCASALLIVVGVAGGVLLHRVKLLRLATETWIAAMASAPIVLMYPLFLVIFGRSAWTIIMIGFVAALPPVILKTLEGLAGTRSVLINVGRSFNLTPSQLYWKILFPAALPSIFVGVRLGMIFALINIVGVEFLINFGGLGQLVNELAERYDLAGTYAAICFVILVSVVFFIATERIEQWLRPGA